ncbi:MAG TPA: glycosyl hydrolase family 8, partial [Patescibacteria group bacterium]|nr:glycosyl hydrolase family 8 [Patescibacteria group bacterium]
LAPYTYWYDHAPAGWMLIALWVKLTGGFFTFGTSVNSGRVLMLALHTLTCVFILYCAKKITKNYYTGTIAVLIFSLSPLGIYFQRRVLLDNIMIFWVFFSLAFLLKDKLRLSIIFLSAILFSISVLSKENAIFFIPAFLYLIYANSHAHHKRFAIIGWIVIVGIVISLYFLYALLNGEFFPVGFLENYTPHVSIITSLQQQLSRGSGYPFWDKRSDFYISLLEWFARDNFIIVTGVVTTIISCLLSIKVKRFRLPAFLALLFWLFLIRGKLTIDFYIVPLIPLLALNTGIVLDFLIGKISFGKKYIHLIFITFCSIGISYIFLSHSIGQYTHDETSSQIETIQWIKNYVSENANIAIDDYMYVDLHASSPFGKKIFPNADWFWKISDDQEITSQKLQNNWMNIQYITLSHEMLNQIKVGSQPMIKKALDNAKFVAEFNKGTTSYFDFPHYISTNGDWMRIYEAKNSNQYILDSSWIYYKTNFIHSYGQVIDPSNGNTTSEGQSYALMRAVWENDPVIFSGVWAWTRDHLEYRSQDKLFSWLWSNGKLGDSNSASDADEDIALSLLFGSKQWGDTSYEVAAKNIIQDIWKNEVIKIQSHYYLTSGSGSYRQNGYLVNPSYLSPATYRIFAQVDTQDNWNNLADDSYYLLNILGSQNGNTTYLPPNWIVLNTDGTITSPKEWISDHNVDFYGFDAFRTMWRVSLDATWYQSPQAIAYLTSVEPFFANQWNKGKMIYAMYNLQGKKQADYSSLSTNVGAIAVMYKTNAFLGNTFYQHFLINTFNFNKGYWNDGTNYYDQNWAWFGTALFSNSLPNLWEKNK